MIGHWSLVIGKEKQLTTDKFMQNQIVFITGASSGIGAACAKIFAHAGAKLILAARRWERLQQLADSLDIPSDKIHLLQLDVCDRLAVESAIVTYPHQNYIQHILIQHIRYSQ